MSPVLFSTGYPRKSRAALFYLMAALMRSANCTSHLEMEHLYLFPYQIICFNGLFRTPTLNQAASTLTHNMNTAISIKANSTSYPFPATNNSHATLGHSNVSMCQVEQTGMGSVEGSPPNADIYSTACSCSDLIHSLAFGISSPSRYLRTLTPVETPTTVKDQSYMYVQSLVRNDSCLVA